LQRSIHILGVHAELDCKLENLCMYTHHYKQYRQ
jgi:hypothetical protein